jgi:CcmD family protein
MRYLRSLLCVAMLSLLIPAFAAAQPPQPPGQEEFVPLSEIPPEEQIPAFTLVAVAYGVVWLVLLGYVWSIGKRLHGVEREITSLSRNRNAS